MRMVNDDTLAEYVAVSLHKDVETFDPAKDIVNIGLLGSRKTKSMPTNTVKRPSTAKFQYEGFVSHFFLVIMNIIGDHFHQCASMSSKNSTIDLNGLARFEILPIAIKLGLRNLQN